MLKPLKQKILKRKKIYGFDVETAGNKNIFVMASIVGNDHNEVYYSRDKFKKDLRLNKFRNSIFVATNLGFDFNCIFDNDDKKNFQWIMRGSDFICIKTYLDKEGNYHPHKGNNGSNYSKIEFWDTLNVVKYSVEKIAKIVGLNKLPYPKCFKRFPKNKKEEDELNIYNLQDSLISYKFLEWFQDKCITLNCEMKMTTPSTAMNCFKKNFLKGEYYVHSEEILREQFKGYYGGRTEAFKRGKVENLNYYDVNSLYPYVMQNKFPDPNTLRDRKYGLIQNIEQFHGMSYVEVYCPENILPLLPLRHDDKLMFPAGNFEGYYTHIELRKALEKGYVIKNIKRQFYYKGNCRPFYEYVDFFYKKRLNTEKRTPDNLIYKLFMNSLYGKFGQKFFGRNEWLPNNFTAEQINKMNFFETNGNFCRIKKDVKPSNFCFPIWAAYVTSYGRLELYKYLERCNPYYCDTDSIMTKKNYETDDSLGGLKLEMHIKEGIIVKPKYYMLNKDIVKIKGIGKKLMADEFMRCLSGKKIRYQKFVKFVESLRRGLMVNEIIDAVKELSNEDNKRLWPKKFNKDSLQESNPIYILKDDKIYKGAHINELNDKNDKNTAFASIKCPCKD
jgi:hypothetical protein